MFLLSEIGRQLSFINNEFFFFFLLIQNDFHLHKLKTKYVFDLLLMKNIHVICNASVINNL